MQSTKKDPIPVSLICGFLGSGKTTLLKNLLHQTSGKKIVVVVNDLDTVSVDAKLVHENHDCDKVIKMENGCICCTLREDLLDTVTNIALSGDIDYILIESTGISEPLLIAETFSFEIEDTQLGKNVTLHEIAKLDTIVTVVDAQNFLSDYTSSDNLQDREIAAGEEDNRNVVDLLVQQVEFSNIILINKIDLISKKQLGGLKAILQKLNPNAKIICTKFAQVSCDEIMNTGLFKIEQAMQNPKWLAEERGTHTPETVEYGISSFIYRRDRPFHPKRLSDCIQKGIILRNVLRSKGFIWLCTNMQNAGHWNQAGDTLRLTLSDVFYANIPKEQWPKKEVDDILKIWNEKYGDRRQEIVFIGIHFNEDEITKELDACLLTDSEMQMESEWANFEDPITLLKEENINTILSKKRKMDDEKEESTLKKNKTD